MIKQSHPRLRKAISMVTLKSLPCIFPWAFKFVVWELMKSQTKIKQLENRIKRIETKVINGKSK